MNIVIAPDSFKGSLTATEVTGIMERAILADYPNYTVIKKPMADGGEGTIESLLSSLNGELVTINCTGPLGEQILTEYAIVHDTTAIIECAQISGLPQVPMAKRNPDFTTTYGMGEVIIDALNRGCTSFIIGLGGSATNDGGLGMLLALGMEAFDHRGNKVGIYGKDVQLIDKVDFSNVDERLKHVDIKIASDVDNPLCGNNGASVVYGPQKGATKEQVEIYDQALEKFSCLVEQTVNQSVSDIPGAGAAGGLGFGLLSIGATIVSGAELIGDHLNIEEDIQNAALVITGEGQSDEQTLYGKAPGYIAKTANKYNVPVLLISGGLKDVEKLGEIFTGCFSIVNKPLSLEECIKQAEDLLFEQTKQILKVITYFKR